MVHSIGLDVVDIARIDIDIKRFGDRFINRILSKPEREQYEKRMDQTLFLAGRFAAKEAVIKALGSHLTDRPALVDLPVLNKPGGQPTLKFPQEVQRHLGKAHCLLSITHEKKFAAAVAVIVEE